MTLFFFNGYRSILLDVFVGQEVLWENEERGVQIILEVNVISCKKLFCNLFCVNRVFIMFIYKVNEGYLN